MSDPSTLIARYEEGAGKLSAAIAGLTPDALTAFPVPGTWSIQQIVLHVADAEMVFADRIKRVIAEESPLLLAFDENRWASHLAYNEQSAPDAAALVELTRRQIARILRTLPKEAFARVGAHSQAGPQTLAQIIERVTGHLDHHLKYLVDKREKVASAR